MDITYIIYVFINFEFLPLKQKLFLGLLYVRVGILLRSGKDLLDRIISLRGEVWMWAKRN
jgi:hypothetical protein